VKPKSKSDLEWEKRCNGAFLAEERRAYREVPELSTAKVGNVGLI